MGLEKKKVLAVQGTIAASENGDDRIESKKHGAMCGVGNGGHLVRAKGVEDGAFEDTKGSLV